MATLLRFAPQIAARPAVGRRRQRRAPRAGPSTPPCGRRSSCATRRDLLPIDPRDDRPGGRARPPRATMRNLGDGGSSDVRSSVVVTALDGLRAAFGDDRVVHARHRRLDRRADADLAVVVVGYTKDDEGEFMGASDMAQLASDLFPPIERPRARGPARRWSRSSRQAGRTRPRHPPRRRPVRRRARRAGRRGADGARRRPGVAAAVRRRRGAHRRGGCVCDRTWSWWS